MEFPVLSSGPSVCKYPSGCWGPCGQPGALPCVCWMTLKYIYDISRFRLLAVTPTEWYHETSALNHMLLYAHKITPIKKSILDLNTWDYVFVRLHKEAVYCNFYCISGQEYA